jgi:hypothetical protein
MVETQVRAARLGVVVAQLARLALRLKGLLVSLAEKRRALEELTAEA